MFGINIFQYKETEIITLVEKKTGQIFFDANQVCKILLYANTSDVLTRLDEDEKKLLKREEFDPNFKSGMPGAVKKWFVNEPGLYNLVLRSDKPEAKLFQRWVTHDVIPSIRKYGSYAMQSTNPSKEIATLIHEAKEIILPLIQDTIKATIQEVAKPLTRKQ